MSNTMCLQTLPLQGSNLDSPDPESGASLSHRGAARPVARQFPPVSASAHTKTHTVSHLWGVA